MVADENLTDAVQRMREQAADILADSTLVLTVLTDLRGQSEWGTKIAEVQKDPQAVEPVYAASRKVVTELFPSATLAHIQVPHPDDVPRIAKLGVVANFEPLWACWDDCQDDLTAPRLGEPRIGWQYPIRRLLDLGAHVSFGSDWPVSDYAPLRYASVAVTRRLDGSEALVADQAIPAPQALRAGTFGVAGQLDAHAPARLTVGGRADLVALSADPRDLVPEEWAGIAVSHRWFAGELVD